MKKLLWGAACLAAMFASCDNTPKGYTVTGVLPDSTFNGTTVYIARYDDQKKIDSAVVENNKVVFTGVADTVHSCFIRINRMLMSSLILENGEITVDFTNPTKPTGTPLNDEFSRLMAAQDSLNNAYGEAYQAFDKSAENWKDAWGTIYENEWLPRFEQLVVESFEGHTDDAVGHALISNMHGMNIDKTLEILDSFGPWLASTRWATEMKENLLTQKKTAVGQPYTDIKGTDIKGNPIALSDFVGKGNYVLVDMWASWCGPCKREIPFLANLHNLYKNKGLTVLGIYVWDKLENLQPAIDKEGITWPQIIDSEENAAKLYGVQGIPCIMLIGPDGTILDRTNLRGDNMQVTVEKFMFGEKK